MTTKIHLGDWTQQSITIGGTGDLTLGTAPGFPTLAESVGINKKIVYTILNSNLSPLEIGYGRLINLNTFRRESVLKTYVDNTYSTGESLTPASIPANSVFFTAPTQRMLEDLILEMPMREYELTNAVEANTDTILLDARHKHILIKKTGSWANQNLAFDPDTLPPVGVKHEITLSAFYTIGFGGAFGFSSTADNFLSITNLTGAHFHFGNGVDFPHIVTPNQGQIRQLDIGLINGSTVSFNGEARVISRIQDNTSGTRQTLVEGVNYSFNAETNILTIINIGTFIQPFRVEYFTYNQANVLLTTTDGGATWVVENKTEWLYPRNLGEVDRETGFPPGATINSVNLDIRHSNSVGRLTDSNPTFTINGVSPNVGLLEPAHFTFINDSQVLKTIIFNSNLFSISGSTLSQVTLPVGYKLDFDVRRNPLNFALSYEVKIGDVNYNQSASGLATTWNPNDYSGTPPLTLSDSNKTIRMTPNQGFRVYRSARAFGGKTQGRWRFAVRNLGAVFSDSGANREVSMSVGLADAGLSLSNFVGGTVSSYSLTFRQSSIINTAASFTTVNGGVGTAVGNFVVNIDDVLGVLVDLDANKIWFTRNNQVLGGGNPEAGTGQSYNLADTVLFPMISIAQATTFPSWSAGIWSIQNEVQDPFLSIWPSFSTWTA